MQPARGWCATVKRDCANCIHLILSLRRPGPPGFWGGSQSCDRAAWLAERQLLAGDIRPNPGPKPTVKTLLHTLTKYTNSPVHPSQSSSPSLSTAHSLPNLPTSVHSPLQNIPTYHRASIQLHTYIPQATYWTPGCLPGGWFLC